MWKKGRLRRSDAEPIDMARREARLGECRSKHGAVIIDSFGLPWAGHNVKVGDGDSIHAEVAAISNFLHQESPNSSWGRLTAVYGAEGATLYSARVKRTGENGIAEPCAACEALILKVGIKRIVYTNESGSPNVIVWED